MTNLFTKIAKSCILPFSFLLITGLSLQLKAQTPQYSKGIGTGSNTIPMNTPGSHCQQIYEPGDFNILPISGNITKIYFRNSVAGTSGTYSNFEVNFLQNSLTAFPNSTFLTGFTSALSEPSITINGNALAGGWYEIPLTTPFPYDNTQTLIVEIKYTARTGGMSNPTSSAGTGINKRLSIITAPGATTGNLSSIWGDFGMDVVPANPCIEPPVPGNIIATSNPVCPDVNFILHLQGGTLGYDQTYQWYSGPSNAGPWTAMGSGFMQSVSQIVDTWYKVDVTCGSTTIAYNPLLVTINPFTACYCPATHTNTCAGHVTNVTLNTLDNTSACNIPALTYPANGSTTTTLLRGVSYNLSITISSNSTLSKSVWFDWNANGLFEVTEHFQLAGTSTSTTPPIAAAGSTTTISVPVPANAALGEIGMRVRTRGASSVNGPGDACTSFGGGESENYVVTIADPVGCTGTPAAGNTVSSATIICPNVNFDLSVINHTFETGIEYQWQSSTDGITYNDIAGETNSTLTTSQSVSHYYQLKVTCTFGGGFAYSVPVFVETHTALSGVYTINSAVPSGGINFQSFTEAATILNCVGISGAVTLNVVAGSGPYTEQFILGEVTGTSSANKITLNGNGETIQFNSTASTNNLRPVIHLNGADWVTIDSLNIVSLNATQGYGILLSNVADNNSITNCVIDMSAVTSTTQSNSAGIVATEFATTLSVLTAGAHSNNLLIEDNEVIGAYQGIRLNGAVSPGQATGNIVRNNIVRDFYADGIHVINQNGVLIDGNDIHRENRTSVTTFAGVTLGAGVKNSVVNGNKIHDTNTSSGTAIARGIFLTMSSTTSPPVSEGNLVSNNLIYNFNSASSEQHGLSNTGSANSRFYHNTVILDYPSSTAGITRGFSQTTAATGIDVKNNIFYITRGGTGIKACLAFTTTTSVITSNNNVLYMNAPAGTSNNIGLLGTTPYSTIGLWRSASGQDLSSVDHDPQFAAPNINVYITTNPLVHNIGANVLSIVPFDIEGNARSATPDPGAIEFYGLPSCLGTPVAGTISSSQTNICYGTSITIDASGYTEGVGIEYQWIQSSSAAGPFTAISGANGFSHSTGPVTSDIYFAFVVTCTSSNQSDTTNTILISAINPVISFTQGASICGLGSVTLQATAANPSHNIIWYEVPSGGLPVGTGSSFTTPLISTTTTYYVAASEGGAGIINLGRENRTDQTANTNNNSGLVFSAPTGGILQSVSVYPSGSGPGTLTIALKTGNTAGATILSSITVNLTGVTIGSAPKTVIPLNFVVPPGTNYYLSAEAFSGGLTGLGRELSNGGPFPYTAVGTDWQITGSWLTTSAPTTTTYYYFYDWKVLQGCEGARVPVEALVSQPDPVSITASQTDLCGIAPGTTTITLTASSPNTNYNYSWTGPDLNSNSGALVTATITQPGWYIVTGEDGICTSVDSIFISIGNLPSVTASTASSVICAGSSVQLTAIGLSNTFNPCSIQVGTNTTSINSAGPIAVLSATSLNVYSRHIAIYTAAEIFAAGGNGGVINQLSWNKISTASYLAADAQFDIYIKPVSFTQHAATPIIWANEIAGATLVYSSTSQSIPAATGWLDFPLTTPFNWNGVDNLEIFVDWHRPSSPSGSITWQYTVTTNGSATTSSSTLVTDVTRSNNRPNIRFTGTCGSLINYSWTSASDLNNPNISNPVATPSTSTTYTVIATDDDNGCTASASVNVDVISPSSPIASNVNRCGPGVVNLTATPEPGGTVFWWNQNSGGSLLQIGNNYSPFVTNNTTFHVSSMIPQGPSTISTGFNGGIIATDPNAAGNMFDVVVMKNLKLNTFDVHLNTASSVPSNISVYYKQGTFVGSEFNPSAWTLAGTATGIVSAGLGVPTQLPLNLDLFLQSGQTYGFYIVVTNLGLANSLIYTSSALSPALGGVGASDGNLQVLSGTINFGPFTGQVGAPINRLWNGNVHYSLLCESPRIPVNAIIDSSPSLSISGDLQICEGSSATLSISSGLGDYSTFNWSPAIGLNSTTGSVVTASPATTTTYSVLASGNQNNCQAIATFTLNVINVNVNITASSQLACGSGAVQLNTTVTPTYPSLSYSWSNDPGLSNLNIANPTALPPTIGQPQEYEVMVTDNVSGCTGTSSITIYREDPLITSVNDNSRCGLGTIALSAVSNSGDVNWWDQPVGGSLVHTGNNFNPFVINTTTYYTSTVKTSVNDTVTTAFTSNLLGTLAGTTAGGNMFDIVAQKDLIIHSFDVHIHDDPTLGPADISVYIKQGSYLGSQLNASAWTLVGSVSGVTSLGYGIPTPLPLNLNLKLSGGQTYGIFVVAHNLDVNNPLRYNNSAASPPLGSIAGGDENINVLVGTANFGPFTSNVASPVNRLWNGRVHYSLYCESPRVPVLAEVTPAPPLEISGSLFVCNTESTTLSVTTGIADYTQFDWTPSTGLNITSGPTVIASPSANVTYVVFASGNINGCQATDTLEINVVPKPLVNVTSGSGTFFCDEAVTQLNAGVSTQSEFINTTNITIPSSGAATPYPSTINVSGIPIGANVSKIKLYNINHTGAEDVDIVLVSPTGQAVIILADAGALTAFDVTIGQLTLMDGAPSFPALPSAPFEYSPTSGTWSGGVITGMIGSFGTSLSTFTGDFNGSWNLFVYDDVGGFSGSINGGWSIEFSGVTPPTILWSPSTGLSSATIADPIATPTTSTTYIAVVTDPVTGCTSTDSITITIEATPLPVITASDTLLCSGEVAVLSTQYSNDPGYSFVWNVNQGADPTYETSSAGFGHTVVVTSPNGCVSQVSDPMVLSAVVYILDESSLVIEPASCIDGYLEFALQGFIIPSNQPVTGSNYFYSIDSSAYLPVQPGNAPGTIQIPIAAGLYDHIYVLDATTGCVFIVVEGGYEHPSYEDLLLVVDSIAGASCFGYDDGYGSVIPSGGTGSYTVTWLTPTPKTGESNNELPAGTVTVELTDNITGCTYLLDITIPEPNPLVVDLGEDLFVPWGSTNGTTVSGCQFMSANVTGGTAPYSYSWNTGHSTDTFTLCYSKDTTITVIVTVTDVNGCSATDTLVLVWSNIDCSNNSNGTKVMICHVPPGNPGACKTVCVSVSAASTLLSSAPMSYVGKCQKKCPTAARMSGQEPGENLAVNVFPNPTNGKVVVDYMSDKTEATSIEVLDLQGRVLISSTVGQVKEFMKEMDLSTLENGLYILNIMNHEGVISTSRVVKAD